MIARIAAIVAAVLAYAFVIPPRVIERVYSQGIYAALQPVLTSASNSVPFALLDVLAAVVLVLLAAGLVNMIERLVSRRSWKPVGRSALNLLTFAALSYLVFLLAWGFNYERQPLTDRLSFDADAAGPDAVLRLAGVAVQRLNDTYEPAHRAGFPEWVDLPAALHNGFDTIQSRLTPGVHAVPGVPKRSVLTRYFERAGVSGMTDPFFLEVLVDQNLLPFERPFVLAHEWAHLAGYANEGEANFVGFLTCVNSQPFAVYSGWLYLYVQTLAAVPPAQRAALIRSLKPGPTADLAAVRQRLQRVEPRLQAVSWRVYDRYLRANRIPQGVASYDRALLLVLGVRFTDDWLPMLRPPVDPTQMPSGR